MKIAFVTTHLSKMGGAGRVVLDFANHLSKNGHDITIISQKINRDAYRFKEEIAVREIKEGPLPSNLLYWIKLKKIQKEYLKVLNNLDVDILISQMFPVNYFCTKVFQRKNIKNIYYCHEPYRFFYDKKFYSSLPLFMRIVSFSFRYLFKWLDLKAAYDADYILCNSKFTSNNIQKTYGKKGLVFYNKILPDDINNKEEFNIHDILQLPDSNPILFSLGFSHHMKGAEDLIKIYKKILKSNPETVLVIGGSVDKYNKKVFRNTLSRYKIPKEKVIFFGYISEDHINNFYSQSFLTLYPAIDEPFGLIPVESLYFGTPVIAFTGGPSESIVDGETGFIIKNHDLDDFAKKAILLINDKNKHDEFSINAIEHIKKNFNQTTLISRFENFLKELIN